MNRAEQDQTEREITQSDSEPRLHEDLFEAMRIAERWSRASDRALRTGASFMDWKRLADDALQVRETVIAGLQRLNSLEYDERMKSLRAASTSSPHALTPQTGDGEEDFQQIWDDLPLVEEWTNLVKRVLDDSRQSEVLLGVTKAEVPLIMMALENSQELLEYLHDWVKRTEQEVGSSHPCSHE
jgi:hypothetical protein